MTVYGEVDASNSLASLLFSKLSQTKGDGFGDCWTVDEKEKGVFSGTPDAGAGAKLNGALVLPTVPHALEDGSTVDFNGALDKPNGFDACNSDKL